MVDTEDVPSAPSTPVTPGTPGAPLFGRFNLDRSTANSSRSFLRSCTFVSSDSWAMKEGSLAAAVCSLPHPPVSFARKVFAEFVGTLILIFSGAGTAIVNQKTEGSVTLLGLAASTGLAVMIVILSTGHISGAHLNPSVTIAFAALKHFSWKQVPIYIGAQVTASICAGFALKRVFHPFMGGGVTVPTTGYGQAFALEFIITFNLMFVITAVATDTRAWRDLAIQVGDLAGIAVGATVMLNVLIAGYGLEYLFFKKIVWVFRVSHYSKVKRNIKSISYSKQAFDCFSLHVRESTGASMNPVRTLGPAIAANNYKAIWVYLTAPVLGALCGAAVYSAVKLTEDDTQEKPTAAVRRLRR
ncbi:Aquaporin NIP6-1 [Asimina triloba]